MITQVLSSGGGGREGGRGDGWGGECVFWLTAHSLLFTSDLRWHLKQQKTEEEDVKAFSIRGVHS